MTSITSVSPGSAVSRRASRPLGTSVECVLQAHRVGERPSGGLPAVAVLGRSNVGKSSLLNALLGVKVARVSQTPGRTQALYWYRVDGRFDLVDCPGYGYAKTAKEKRAEFSEMIEALLSRPPQPAALLLVDSRIDPQASDLSMSAFLSQLRLPTLVAFTKWDAVKASQRVRKLRALGEAFRGDADAPARALLPVSAETGENLRELARLLPERVALASSRSTLTPDQKENS